MFVVAVIRKEMGKYTTNVLGPFDTRAGAKREADQLRRLSHQFRMPMTVRVHQVREASNHPLHKRAERDELPT